MTTPAEELSRYTTQAQMGSFMVDKMGLVSVKAFGAKGDGVTNDTAAVLSAKAFALANGLVSIFFPHGNYVLDSGTGALLSGYFLWGDNSTVTGDSLTINQIGANNTEYITNFTGLTDAPKSYSDQSGKVLAVKSTEDALELRDIKKELQDEITDDRKLSPTGNFTGSWKGVTDPSLSEPGLAGTVLALKGTGDAKEKTNKEDFDSHLADYSMLVVNVLYPGHGLSPAENNTDSTTAINAMIDYLDSVGGGTLFVPKNYTFIVDTINLKSNIIVTGGGTLKFKTNTAAFTILLANGINDVDIHGLVFDGNISNQAEWSEYRHCIKVFGSTNVKIYGNKFVNIVGDGIYISHNGDFVSPDGIEIYSNRFIGTAANRNGISIIHGKNIDIHHNYLYYMGKDTMPGGINLEPDANTETVDSINIHNNRIIGGGTPGLQHGVSINNNVGAIITNVVVNHNILTGVFNYAISCFGDNADKEKTQAVISNNIIKETITLNLSAAIIASSRCICDITNNKIDATTDYGIKLTGCAFKVIGNRIKNCAEEGIEENGAAFDAGIISENLIEDCGTNAAASYGGIHITGSYLDITNNKVLSSATAKTQVGLYIETGVKNFIDGNTFRGVGVRAIAASVAPQVFGHNIHDKSFCSINGTYPPIAESWVLGDRINNPIPAAGGYAGWVCTEAGTPGTWKGFGVIQA